jgi:hypothetical protein
VRGLAPYQAHPAEALDVGAPPPLGAQRTAAPEARGAPSRQRSRVILHARSTSAARHRTKTPPARPPRGPRRTG